MGRTFVVGISGASASGKSTISERLKQLLENHFLQTSKGVEMIVNWIYRQLSYK